MSSTGPTPPDPAAPAGSRTPDVDLLTRASRRYGTHPILVLALGLAGGLMLAATVGSILSSARSLVINLVVALFLSFALEPAVKWLANRGVRRGIATGIVFVLGAIALGGFVAAMLPLVVDQAANLVDNVDGIIDGLIRNAESLPDEVAAAAQEWLREFQRDLPRRVPELASNAASGVLSIGASLFGTIFNLLTIALVTFYMTADAPKLRAALAHRMTPRRQAEFIDLWELAIDKTGGYVYSRVLTLVASTLFHWLAFALIGIPYPLPLGLWVGVVSSLVPVVGTYVAGVLPIIVALAGSPADTILVLLALTAYQGAENYVIVPRVAAHALSLHPGVAFVSVLLGGTLLGAVGALLAIPAAAIVAALFSARDELSEHEAAEAQDQPVPGGAVPA